MRVGIMRFGIVVASSVLVLGACSSATTEATSETEEETQESSETEVYRSPIADFLGFDTAAFASEENQEEFAEQEREAQQQIAVCMRDEGFEYTPIDNSDFISFEGGPDGDGPEWGSKEWVEKYGFGISTMRFSQATVGPNLVGYDDGRDGLGDDGPSDPNQIYVESLTPEEQEAYYAALYGTDQGPEGIDPENMTEEEINEAYEDYYENEFVPSGCNNEVYEEIYNNEDDVFGDNEQMNAFNDEFGDELEDLFERMQNDPRMIEQAQKISTCVADKGYSDYVDEESVYEDIDNRMGAMSSGGFNDPFADFTDEQMESMSEEDFEEIINQANGETLSDADLATLAEVQEYEIGLALAVDECGGGYWNDANNEIRIEIEQEWLDENADRIASYEGAGGS